MIPPPPFFQTLSQTLVAFTIEVDNEWEHRFWIHADPPPLRTSLVMWANFLRFVREDGITVRELSGKAGYPEKRAHPDLPGMLRWRFVTAEPGPGQKPTKLDQIIRPTRVGAEAAAAWEPLPAEVEARWADRFGQDAIQRLRNALLAILNTLEKPLPHYYSVLEHKKGMRALDPADPACDLAETLPLPFLLSQVSQRFTLDFERTAEISMALQANLIRVLTVEPVDKRNLPQLTGISKEALSMGINFLKKRDILVEEPSASGRGKAIRLTESGLALQSRFPAEVKNIENAWEAAYSAERIDALRSALKPFSGADNRLFEALTPYPECWRASVPPPAVLPYHPMVLYRGGWPDGS